MVRFNEDGSGRNDAKAFAVNPEAHCGFGITARSLDEAKQQAMKPCGAHWIDCKFHVAGRELVERTN
jgi:hypothetical protein